MLNNPRAIVAEPSEGPAARGVALGIAFGALLALMAPDLAEAQQPEAAGGENQPKTTVDVTAPPTLEIGPLSPAELDAYERRRALLNTDDPSWSRKLSEKWALESNKDLEPPPAADDDKGPVGLKLRREF